MVYTVGGYVVLIARGRVETNPVSGNNAWSDQDLPECD